MAPRLTLNTRTLLALDHQPHAHPHAQPPASSQPPERGPANTPLNARDRNFIRSLGDNPARTGRTSTAGLTRGFSGAQEHRFVHLHEQPFTLRFEYGLENATASFKLPKHTLGSGRSAQAVLDNVASLRLGEPWAKDADVKLTAIGNEIQVEVPVDSPGAWSKIAPRFELELKSGRSILLEVSSDELVRDSTAHTRGELEQSLKSFRSARASQVESLNRWRKKRDLLRRTSGSSTERTIQLGRLDRWIEEGVQNIKDLGQRVDSYQEQLANLAPRVKTFPIELARTQLGEG